MSVYLNQIEKLNSTKGLQNEESPDSVMECNTKNMNQIIIIEKVFTVIECDEVDLIEAGNLHPAPSEEMSTVPEFLEHAPDVIEAEVAEVDTIPGLCMQCVTEIVAVEKIFIAEKTVAVEKAPEKIVAEKKVVVVEKAPEKIVVEKKTVVAEKIAVAERQTLDPEKNAVVEKKTVAADWIAAVEKKTFVAERIAAVEKIKIAPVDRASIPVESVNEESAAETELKKAEFAPTSAEFQVILQTPISGHPKASIFSRLFGEKGTTCCSGVLAATTCYSPFVEVQEQNELAKSLMTENLTVEGYTEDDIEA